MTHGTTLTAEYVRRTQQEVVETERVLAKEMGISEDLRYMDKVARLEAHIAYLKRMITLRVFITKPLTVEDVKRFDTGYFVGRIGNTNTWEEFTAAQFATETYEPGATETSKISEAYWFHSFDGVNTFLNSPLV